MGDGGGAPVPIRVTPAVAREVVEELGRKAPDGWRFVPIEAR